MLLIGDIHINSSFQDNIILWLQKYINANPDEENIIFLGDYVYHFAYDRTALLALYDLFVDLFFQWKSVYILAGNHDRLGQHFVYAEAQKAFQIISKKLDSEVWKWKIYFITEPKEFEIEWEDVFFLPYVLPWVLNVENISKQRTHLLESELKNEKLSGQINEIVWQKIQKKSNFLLIHHYYFNKTQFPGQKSKFAYKDVALSEDLFNANIKIISWHLHAPFVYKNYLCLGSIRSTSSLEFNQIKCLAKYNPQTQKTILTEISINPYIFIELETQQGLFEGDDEIEAITQKTIDQKIENLILLVKDQLSQSSQRNIEFQKQQQRNLRQLTVSIKVPDLDYEKIDNYIDKDFRTELKDVRLKKQTANISQIIEKFNTEGKNLSSGFADRKEILKQHLKQQYLDDYEKYMEVLRDLKLL